MPRSVDEDDRFGRGAEEARVRALLDRLPTRGGVLVVSGEAGIGKSSLLRGLRAEALSGAASSSVGTAAPSRPPAAPYRSWRAAVEALAARRRRSTPDARGPDQESAGALLATHLGELDRLRAGTEPAVIVIDDLQWADDATLSLLGFLAPELERLRILLGVGVRRAGVADLAPRRS